MSKAITTTTDPAELAALNDLMTQAGQAANEAGARHTFAEHTARKASNTTRRKRADLELFETFLQSAGIPARDLFTTPAAWRGITWGIVEAFRNWMLQEGYAIGSINGRLSTVRTFAKLAAKAGAISPQDAVLIASVQGYARKEIKHLDERRRADGMQTRKASQPGKDRKKSEAVTIPEDIAQAMKAQADTEQGRRDALIMCLLLEHGLRVGEVAILTRQSFDMQRGELIVYRPKVAGTDTELQTHAMTRDTRRAAAAYLPYAPEAGIVWRKSNKGTGKLGAQVSAEPGTAERFIARRVELIGRHAGIMGLSPHDCRHYAATWEARQGTDINQIKTQFGWNSYQMAGRYIKAAAIANDGSARLKDK